MRVQGFAGMWLVTLLASDASAQFRSARPPVSSKASVTSAASTSPGAFLGSDACTSAHTPAGTGSVAGVPFTTGTTGTQGQNEANCYAFGSTFIDNDVWYDWTASFTGDATVSTCGGTGVDTKIAIYPFTGGSSCPADGTSLACNDDACGLQSGVAWPVTVGTTYTLQVGTFPGAAGGSGTFDITESAPNPCGTYDDGTSENALGLIAGGQTGWLHGQDCLYVADYVYSAYGTPLGVAPPNGTSASVHVYEDADCDLNPTTPAGGMSVKWSLATTVTNTATDILNEYPAPMGANTQILSGCSWAMVTSNQAAGEFPAPMDQTNTTPNAWVAGSTLGPNTMDTTNLNNNSVAPLQAQAIGFPTSWLLRTQNRYCRLHCNTCYGQSNPQHPSCIICWNPPCTFGGGGGVQMCFGDSGCPCGNNGDGSGGCQNSLGTGGAILSSSGVPSFSNDTLVLTATRTPNQPGVFFQGDSSLVNPPIFGDGFRCCGVNVLRIGTYLPSGNTTNTATGNLIGGFGPPISQHPGNASLQPGDARCYQWWYRDPTGPCGGFFNLSNSIGVVWVP